MIKLEMDFEISEESLQQFAEALYYNTNLIADVKACIARYPEDYARFLEKEAENSD